MQACFYTSALGHTALCLDHQMSNAQSGIPSILRATRSLHRLHPAAEWRHLLQPNLWFGLPGSKFDKTLCTAGPSNCKAALAFALALTLGRAMLGCVDALDCALALGLRITGASEIAAAGRFMAGRPR